MITSLNHYYYDYIDSVVGWCPESREEGTPGSHVLIVFRLQIRMDYLIAPNFERKF